MESSQSTHAYLCKLYHEFIEIPSSVSVGTAFKRNREIQSVLKVVDETLFMAVALRIKRNKQAKLKVCRIEKNTNN